MLISQTNGKRPHKVSNHLPEMDIFFEHERMLSFFDNALSFSKPQLNFPNSEMSRMFVCVSSHVPRFLGVLFASRGIQGSAKLLLCNVSVAFLADSASLKITTAEPRVTQCMSATSPAVLDKRRHGTCIFRTKKMETLKKQREIKDEKFIVTCLLLLLSSTQRNQDDAMDRIPSPVHISKIPHKPWGWWVIKTRVYNISGMGHSFLKGFLTKTWTINIEQKHITVKK
jgi:hypothetical protein